MIHVLQKKPLGVWPIARVMQSEILPRTRPQRVKAGHDALDDDRRGFRLVALSYELFAGDEFADFATQAADRGDISAIDRRVILKFSQKDIAWRHFF